MTFRTNLQYLRSQRHMTQEQLAMLVGVSRQAVSKWESEKAYPEMDKLLVICDLFGCSLDDLVMGDVSVPGSGQAQSPADTTDDGMGRGYSGAALHMGGGTQVEGADAHGSDIAGRVPEASASADTSDSPGVATDFHGQDVTGYDGLRRVFALCRAGGVAMIFIGLGLAALLGGIGDGEMSDDAVAIGPWTVWPASGAWSVYGGVAFSLCLIVAVGLFLFSNMTRREFRRSHPFLEDFYTERQRDQISRQWLAGRLVGIVLILLGVLVIPPLATALWHWPANLIGAVFFWSMGFGCFALISSRYWRDMADIEAYNRRSEDRGDHHRAASGESWRHSQDSSLSSHGRTLSELLSTVIMSIATIIALIMLFTGNGDNFFGLPIPFFMFWVIGGLLCGLINPLLRLFEDPSLRRHE